MAMTNRSRQLFEEKIGDTISCGPGNTNLSGATAVRHTREPRLHGSRYRNAFCIAR